MPVSVLHEWTEQPCPVDLRVNIYTKDANELIADIRQAKPLGRRDETFRQGGADVRFAFPEEADVMCPVAVQARHKLDKFAQAISAGSELYQ